MQEAAPADRPDLAGGKEPGGRRASELALDHLGVMVGDAKHRGAPAVAREHERSGRALAGERLDPQLQRLAEVLVGRARIARMQTHDLARRRLRADDERARFAVRAEDAAYEEVALVVLGLAAVDHHADQ